ncbi:hypothetical protein CLIM01_14387 [Colletotrichum limetticola]|uniref:Uncharacterized protein n=1 Tax=Colletotrichum limetticola TaxID=1209924 RepID=A0ABQ9P824_9PEZI|nr:hypothetical protein CLIM01_14387 [Colletotrichum limetticola]
MLGIVFFFLMKQTCFSHRGLRLTYSGTR